MFNFTIRELLMLMAIVGLVLGWQLDRWHQAVTVRQHAKLREVAERQLAQLAFQVERAGFEISEDKGGWISISRRRTDDQR